MSDLVERATGHRHGLLSPPVLVPPSAADPPGVHHASVAFEGRGLRSAGGGVARDPRTAELAAVAEAIERYAATHATLPLRRTSDLVADGATVIALGECSLHSRDQRRDPTFPHPDAYAADPWMTMCFSLPDNDPVWVPAALVSLTPDFGALATSSGLAIHDDPTLALLRAVQELIERDAYMSTWLHQLGGRLVDRRAADQRLGGELRVYDLTPAYSPHPVAAVAGTMHLDGWPRHSLGLACRSSWEAAVERAELEFFQGTVFVGHLMARAPHLWGIAARSVTGFDEHAVYYTANPDQWDLLPLHRHAVASPCPTDGFVGSASDELGEVVDRFLAAGGRLCYRDLTTVDVNQLGLTAVRAFSPDLTPIHHDHRWPFLGGRSAELEWRYPDATTRRPTRAEPAFPTPFPHALG